YTKDEIREIARENGFITADKKDSQEICFVEDNDYANFITTNYNYKSMPGEFVDTKGNKYGKHKGIIHYTVGQRRGLGLSLKSPLYVKRVDNKTHEVILCPKEELFTDSLICSDVNLMALDKLDAPIKASVKIRYSAPKSAATLIPLENGDIKVVFDEPARAVTPGQAVVFYDENKVLGGGIIQ
ncbi:MAG: tRNA 2-thiouridine(34) synthase MnmA, partial [Clostridia bacterium]|nr:tRNA 2-thiouridine(34) synthase MnmA [Clostridia bacterium]